MKNTLHLETKQAAEELLKGPDSPGSSFSETWSYGDVFAMAGTILNSCRQVKENQRCSLVVFTEDRGVIAAAIMAAMAGGPILVFPNDISDRTLADLPTDSAPTGMITDQELKLPGFVNTISLNPAGNGSDSHVMEGSIIEGSIDMDAPLLRLYTGGSTGKSVIWTKTVENMMSETMFHVRTHGITSDDVMVATVPPYHIYGLLFSVIVPLMAGATVADRTFEFPREIVNAVIDKAATLLVSVPPTSER